MLWRLTKPITLAFMVIFTILCATPVLAAWLYMFPTIAIDTTATARAYYPVMLGYSGQSLMDAGKISATGLNTNMQIEASSIKYMISTDNVVAVIPSLPSLGQVSLDLYTGYTPEQTNFPIIVGDGGNVTALDHADIELDAHFEVEFLGYVNTDNGSNKNLVYKQNAFRIYVPSAQTIRGAIIAANGTEVKIVEAAGVASGNHTVKVTADGSSMKLYIDGFESDSVSIVPLLLNGSPYSSTERSSYIGGHKTFYANGRYWVFYSNSTKYLWYESATDGTTWGVPTLISNNTSGDDHSVWFDGTHVHYVRTDDTAATKTMYYRCGTPSSNGTISWLDAEKAVSTGNFSHGQFCMISVDTSGYPFIIYRNWLEYPTVTKSSTNNGSWTTEGGYPHVLQSSDSLYMTLAPLTGGDMYAVWSGAGLSTEMKGALYNGSWQASVEITNNAPSFAPEMSLTSDNAGNAWLVYDWDNGGANREVRVKKFNGATWGSHTLLTATNSTKPQPACSYEMNTYALYAFWYDSATEYIMYKKYIGGTWDSSPTSWISTSGDTFNTLPHMVSSPYSDNAQITLLYRVVAGGNHRVAIADFGNTYVPDNVNSWAFDQNNVMPYMDYVKITNHGTLALRWEPNTAVNGTEVYDRAGTNQPGTIHWGANTGITLVYGEMLASEDTEHYIPRGHYQMPSAPMPSTWFAAGENLANLPFYDVFSEVSAQTGQPVQMLYALGIIGLAFGIFLLVVVFTRSTLMAFVSMLMVLIFGSSMTIIPWWIIFVMLIIGFGIMYLYRQVSY